MVTCPRYQSLFAMQAIQVQRLGQAADGQRQNPPSAGVSLSAEAAQQALQAVNAFVAITQIQQVCHALSWLDLCWFV